MTVSSHKKVPNLVLRRIRELERHETRSEFAEAIAQKAMELGENISPSERYVARLEDGETRYPHPPYRRVLTELCQRSVTDLGFSSPRSTQETTTVSPGPTSDSSREHQYAVASSAGSLRDIETLRRSIDERVSDTAIGSSAIDDWELSVIRHGRATRYQEPGILLADLTSDLAELNHILSRSRSASSVRRLTRVTAQMAGLVCLMLVKLDERASFRRWARTARITAEEAGDPLTVSWVRAQEAYGYYYSGEMLEAIDVARHAQLVAGSVPCVGAVLAVALEARALASLGSGRSSEAEQALRYAEEILSNLDSSEIIPSAFGYSEAQLRFHEGNTYTHLRDTDAAWKAQQRALELIPGNDYMDRTLTNLDRAVCLAHDRDSRHAIAHAAVALTGLSEQQREGIITSRARELLRAVPAPHRALPAVREFSDLLALPAGGEDG